MAASADIASALTFTDPSSAPATSTTTPSTTAYAPSQTSAMAASGTLTSETHTQNGEAESSKMGMMEADPTYHALNLSSYIYNAGYLGQNWADIHLTFFQTGAKLHRIIIARSPYLAHLMMSSAPGSTLHLSFNDANITPDAMHICLQHLYNPSLALVSPDNARAILATALLLQGMPEMVQHAYYVARESLSPETILDFIRWVSSGPSPNGNVYVAEKGAGGGEGWAEGGYAVYGEWSVRLKQDVLDYLLTTLPSSHSDPTTPLTSNPALQSTYSRLPFDLFKHCVESLDLPNLSIQDRFSFAKRVIALRKKIPESTANMEESVVLAFKGGDGTQVLVTRKPKKGRTALWKVEG